MVVEWNIFVRKFCGKGSVRSDYFCRIMDLVVLFVWDLKNWLVSTYFGYWVGKNGWCVATNQVGWWEGGEDFLRAVEFWYVRLGREGNMAASQADSWDLCQVMRGIWGLVCLYRKVIVFCGMHACKCGGYSQVKRWISLSGWWNFGGLEWGYKVQ